MGTREWPLPRLYELFLGKERDRWPPEARFIEAAHHGDVLEIKKIAKELDVQGHGIPVTVANTTYMGMNALHAAGGLGRLPVYRYLVEEVKMDIHKPDTLVDFTPVEHAVKHGHLPAIKYLLDHGADLHLQRGDDTLLHSAASRGQSEIVKFLLSKGADVDAISDLGTPLLLAALKGHPSTLKILLQHGADPNKVAGLFGIIDVALHKSSVSCVKLLIQFGRLPIELAVEYGTREDVEILFPFTSPISTVANWSVDGIISHVQMEIKQLEDDNFVEKRISDLKQQAAEALKMDNFDAKLLSNRSLCWLRMGDGERSYDDATECKKLQPNWAKAYYRQGAAQILMEDYDDAYHSLLRALGWTREVKRLRNYSWRLLWWKWYDQPCMPTAERSSLFL